ncbi:MAG: GIY-YIG nuclease family protein [Candidatus Anaerobiospirillum pullicola]|uniref:GIY-YIG nuclease family protein n=1 Tax=Candidatus Anaerobiospirillum pullicola TaxID=2838451 RepID=A0A948THY4_9GAMM|nr:GIY-YIG nuclease family protein [Candidatus Anaerobiospirillum pullicola]
MNTPLQAQRKKPNSLEDIFAEIDADPRLKRLVLARTNTATTSRKIDHRQEHKEGLKQFVATNQRLPEAESQDHKERGYAYTLSKLQPQETREIYSLLPQQPVTETPTPQDVDTAADTTPAAPSANDKKAEQQSSPPVDDILAQIFAKGERRGKFSEIKAVPPILSESALLPERGAAKKRKGAKDVAQATACSDYATYEPLLSRCLELWRSGDLVTHPVTNYRQQHLNVGQFFLNDRLLALVASSYEHDQDKAKAKDDHHKTSYRVKVVYNNATQITPWNYSFLESLVKSSGSASFEGVTDRGERFLRECKQKLSLAQAQEQQQQSERKTKEKSRATGYLYILQTLSTSPELTQFLQHSELVKIGFCTTPVIERIRNAEHSSTYLYAPVRLVRVYKCFGLDPHTFEMLMHKLLNEHRFNVTLTDSSGKKYRPEEWFTVSPLTACEIADHILDGTIAQYRVDSIRGKLVKINS